MELILFDLLMNIDVKYTIPFLINKLVTRRRASRGDLLKKFGDRFGGNVNGFRLPAVPVSHARIDPCG